MQSLRLLSVTTLALAIAASQAAEQPFFAQLQELSSGPSYLYEDAEATARVKAAIDQDPKQSAQEGLGGVKFGATCEQVIAIWGTPNTIHVNEQMVPGTCKLTIGASDFYFVKNALYRISLHSADFESAYGIMSGRIHFGQPLPELSTVFTDISTSETDEWGDNTYIRITLAADISLRFSLDEKKLPYVMEAEQIGVLDQHEEAMEAAQEAAWRAAAEHDED